MDAIVVGLVALNTALFVALAIVSLRVAWRDHSPRIRRLALACAMASSALLFGGVQRLALQAERLGHLTPETADRLLFDWQLLKSLGTLMFTLTAIVVARRALMSVRQVDHAVEVLTTRVKMPAAVSELGLTPRELEVLDVIGSGSLADAEIAHELQISAHTAHTHVRNIMAKAGVRSRRALLLLVDTPKSPDNPG